MGLRRRTKPLVMKTFLTMLGLEKIHDMFLLKELIFRVSVGQIQE